ncbi:hypothetical protein GF340_05390 [Candidatus Peregrinibacteria bacterium]|nr:hypothetical protein [Candidatus Peregrinibacteria bacterium]
MPSNRAVLKPSRIWDGQTVTTIQPRLGKLPFAKDIYPGIGMLEFHNCEHWDDNRYLFETSFGYQLYDSSNNSIPIIFDMEKHFFAPEILHSEFVFSDGSNRIIQDIAAVDDVFVCRISLEKPGNYNILTITGRPWFDFKTDRMSDYILLEILSGNYKGTFAAFHASFHPDSNNAVLTGSTFFAAQFKGNIENVAYLVLAVDDNKERLMQQMCKRINDPESVFGESQTDWQTFFEKSTPKSPKEDTVYEKVISWASFYIKSNIINKDKNGVIPGWTVGCGKGSFTGCPVENTQYHLLSEQYLNDSSYVTDELSPRCEQDAPWHPLKSFNTAHYLFNPYVMKQLYKQKYIDRNFMKQVMTSTEETIQKVFETRDKGDGLFWTDTHLDTPMGFDNSSRWDKAYGNKVPFEWKNSLALGVKAIEGSCFIVDALNTVAFFRREVDDNETAEKHELKAQEISEQIRRLHWCENQEFFVDIISSDEKKSDIITLAGVAPLWAGIATQEQAEKVANKIGDPKIFKSKYGPTSHAKNHPLYADFWRGDVCLRLNWLVYIGLNKYGFDDLAKWVLDSTILRFKDHNYDGAEMWNPSTGIGYWTQSSEMGLLMDMMFFKKDELMANGANIHSSLKS